jgi:hypothetical protein
MESTLLPQAQQQLRWCTLEISEMYSDPFTYEVS